MKHRKFLWLSILMTFVLMTSIFPPIIHGVSAASDYWPTSDWRTSTPEDQGIDSQKLYSMLKAIRNTTDIHSIIVIRHGYIVLESYMAPYDRNTVHNLKSVSKSFLSALVGIALREKMLTGLDQKVADILPEYFRAGDDPRKKEITIRHLLTMSAGFKWEENTPISRGLWDSENWVKYAIEMPLSDNPGEKFTYSTALTHLMSAILTKVSGMSTQDFARKYFFDPLDINVKLWRQGPQGIYIGGSELFLTPRDMAKFGYLVLNHGIWNGNQIIPQQWVEESVKPQVKTGGWGGFEDYGYWWWLQAKSFSAEGWGGQRIVVSPEQDMVVVFTSANFNLPYYLYDNFILPAVKSEKLAPNPNASAALSALAAELEHPKPQDVSKLPKIASRISGKTFQMKPNNLGIKTLRLNFDQTSQCTLTLGMNNSQVQLPVGLDDLYRVSEVGNELPLAFRGKWQENFQSPATFLLEWITIGEPSKNEGRFILDRNRIDIQIITKPQYEWVDVEGELKN